MLLPMMAPHEMLSLDFDWFYRRWIPKLLMGLSKYVYWFFEQFEQIYDHSVLICRFILRHPMKIFSNLHELKELDDEGAGTFEGEVPVGAFMQIFLIFCIIAFLVILILE